MFLQPLVASSLAAVLLGETLTFPTIAGGLIILGGVYLVTWPARPRMKR
jgi:drug/metabolite transporter (DMT)-like permease